MPARDAWVFVHNTLVGCGLRERDAASSPAARSSPPSTCCGPWPSAPICARCARGMMFALGCIQSLRCNANTCPTGITTQNPALVRGLDVPDKSTRVANFHRNTMKGFLELLGAMGLDHPSELRSEHIFRRVDDLRVRNLRELYEYLEPGQLLDDARLPEGLREEWRQARPDGWTLAAEHGQYGGASLRQESPVGA
jgi:hypothetical protein